MLTLKNVTAGYGPTTVLRQIDLIVPDSSVVALLGPNGAGKTTLLRLAAGVIKPKSGSLLLDGVDVSRRAPHELAASGICHIPEGRGVFANMTVRDNLMVQSAAGKEDESIAKAVAAFPRLGERLEQLAGTMSGGEQQMLAVARAYIQSPRFVLLDEVSMGLAPQVVDLIFDFLDLLVREGSSLLLVEQYVTRALAMCDFVYLLNRGSISFAGQPSELEGEDLFSQYVGTDALHA